MGMHKSTAPDSTGATIRAGRIELFYGLHGLSGSECSKKCIELLEDKKYLFLYPDPSISSPTLVSLILQVCKKRFFHGAILSSMHYFLFNDCNAFGYKLDARGMMMSQLVPEGVVEWVCMVVCAHGHYELTA